jgi:hypothetical protein
MFLILSTLFFFISSLFAQGDGPRSSLKASTSQTIGKDTDVTIVYSRPGVKGRTIWGELVKYGFEDRSGNMTPWRAGANENTTIEFTKDVKVEGKDLAAGKYGLFMVAGEKEWIVIFSKKNDMWGSYQYKDSDDALRVTVKPLTAEHNEWLEFGFDNLAGTEATAYMHWEKVKVPFKISTK